MPTYLTLSTMMENKLKKYTKVADLYVNLTKYNSKLQPTAQGCIEWQGARHTQGYGMVSAIRVHDLQRIMTVSHRIAMRLKLNRPLTSNDDVQHTCANPRCCNPNHLVLKLSMKERCALEEKLKDHELNQIPL